MSSFKDFISNNGIIATTAGITIGFATATFVKSFVADVVLPIVFLALVSGTGKVSSSTSSFFSKFLSNKEFLFTNFISEFITWIAIVLIAWLVLDLVYKYVNANGSGFKMPAMGNPFAPKATQEEHHHAVIAPKQPWESYTNDDSMEQYIDMNTVKSKLNALNPWENFSSSTTVKKGPK